MAMATSFEFDEKLPTELKEVNSFIDRVFPKILEVTGAFEENFKVKLALEEALTNAIRHGNALVPGCYVRVQIKADRKQIMLDVHDEGKGFDFHNLPDPTQADNAVRPSGRGVFLMRKIMDKVEFYDNGSGVKMIKQVP